MRTALVTGASGGIGAETAVKLAREGYAVALHYYTNEEKASAALGRIAEAGGQAAMVQADISDESSVQALMESVHERLGKVCLLVNCAGTSLKQGLFTECEMDEVQALMDVNVKGTMLCIKAVIPDMLELGYGSIVNISSIWGVSGGSCEAAYSASKAAVIGLTKALAKELAPSNIRVNCVAPGFIGTAMNAHLTIDEVAAFAAEVPLGRIGHPADVAQAVAYLSNAGYVTGQTLSVDGGYNI
ncbi:MAG TPA: 3-oxoacyl-ACP reductase FabG [Clostridia bacterium]|nr:3-oxoacyl-ACP reductase FabG [Clostridia bacterium]